MNHFAIPIPIDNSLEVYFSNKKHLITIQTRQIKILKLYFLLKNGISKVNSAQNQLLITFCSDIVGNLKLFTKHIFFNQIWFG